MADEGRPGGAQAAAAPEAGAAKSAELASRAMGMLNASLIVTLPEPAQRSRSYRELILQEMNWMACDYYHERRWKVHAGKQLCIGIKEAAMDRKRLNKNWIASECSLHVKRFWTAVLANSQEETPVSAELAHYCARIARGYRNHVQTDTGDVSRDYDIGERDLIAVTVPPMQQPDGHAYSTRSLEHKNEVLETTILGMQSMGAELYRPIFRPPDDDLDMFTMPLMDPLRDNDFNALLVQNFCLKYCEQPHALARAKEELRSPSVPDITRRFNRPANEASCLAMSVRDFDLQIKPKPPFLGAMVKTQLTSVEFELLDSWMISEATSWPMIAICLTYRSSASGLHRFEYSAEYCKEVFEQFNRQPRGLVNSSRRLLGPRQRNAITTFLDAPPPRLKFRALLDSADQGETAVRREVGLPVGSGKRYAGYCSVGSASLRRVRQRGATRSRGLRALYLAHRALVNEGRGGQSGIVQGDDVDMAMEGSEGVEEHVGDSDGGFRVLGDSKSVDGESVSTESSELQVKLPLLDVKSSDLETMSVVVVHKEASAAVEPNGQSCRGDDGLREGSTAEGKVEGEALGKVVAVPKDAYVEVAMATGKNKAAKCYVSDAQSEPVLHMPNVPYGEYSNRMSKQLRVGFLGIPAKMFAHSLFYSGRFCKNNRVRRVAVTIANATKIMMPQANMLYTRLFENDVVAVFGRFRTNNWQRAMEHRPDAHAEQLLKRYTAEVAAAASKKTKSPSELQPVEVLAAYVGMKVAKGETRQQGALMADKILIKHIEQVVPNTNPAPHPPQQQPQPPPTAQTPQALYMSQMPQMQMQGASVSPHSKGSTPMMHPVMHPPPISLGPMQTVQVPPMQLQHAQMAPGTRPSGAMTPGSNAAGHMTPGPMTPGQMGNMKVPPKPMTPGQMGNIKVPPGALAPGQMGNVKVPPGMPPPQLQGKAPPGPMHLEQMKRRPPMDMAGKRRPMMPPYEQMYPPQVNAPPYRYRPAPDVNMLRVPMYPMPMYNKQVPYPKAHEDQYRSPHMQR